MNSNADSGLMLHLAFHRGVYIEVDLCVVILFWVIRNENDTTWTCEEQSKKNKTASVYNPKMR